MGDLLIEYKKRWYLFLACILLSWLSLAVAFYTPMLIFLALGLPLFNAVLTVMSLVLFALVAPLPIHLLNRKLSKVEIQKKHLLLSSVISAVALLGIALLSFIGLSGGIDWGSGQIPGLSLIVSAFVVVFWALALLMLIIRIVIKIVKSTRKKSGVAALLLLPLILTACSDNGLSAFDNRLTSDDVWNPTNFANVGQSVDISDMPHGHFSIPLIRHMNDNLYERSAFTYRELETAVWIVDELLATGYTWDDIEIQEFSWADISFRSWLSFGEGFLSWLYASNEIILTRFFSNQVHRQNISSQNIILTIPGISDETIIIGAHYDSVLTPGATDNASGTALLLESVRRMRHQENYHTLVYIFFGAHETGLVGSRFYVDNMIHSEHDNLLFMINADALINSEYIFHFTGFDDGGSPGENEITRQIEHIALEFEDTNGVELFTNPQVIYQLVDSAPFLHQGHTILFLATATMPYSIQHTHMDDWNYITETRPGVIESSMRNCSILLESLLLARW